MAAKHGNPPTERRQPETRSDCSVELARRRVLVTTPLSSISTPEPHLKRPSSLYHTPLPLDAAVFHIGEAVVALLLPPSRRKPVLFVAVSWILERKLVQVSPDSFATLDVTQHTPHQSRLDTTSRPLSSICNPSVLSFFRPRRLDCTTPTKENHPYEIVPIRPALNAYVRLASCARPRTGLSEVQLQILWFSAPAQALKDHWTTNQSQASPIWLRLTMQSLLHPNRGRYGLWIPFGQARANEARHPSLALLYRPIPRPLKG